MNSFGAIFSLVTCLLIAAVPRRWLFVPVMVSVCYMTMGQMLNVGGIHIFAYRLALIVALLRGMLRGELQLRWKNRVDRQVIILCVCAVVTGLMASHIKSSIGSAVNILGFYLVFRSIIGSIVDSKRMFLQVGLIVIPLAILMVMERVSGQNAFFSLGGVETELRLEKFRAQGPFRHSILAGTAGALIALPLIALYKEYPKIAVPGIIAACAMIVSSSSSGPYLTLATGCVALAIYRYRTRIRSILYGLLFVICCLEIVMKDHVWYLVGRFDLVGGSTGWWRAELITQAFRHINEWWFVGTSYTRHWMPSGVSWSENHTDITNQYIFMGVEGGLPLMISFIAMLMSALVCSYRACRMYDDIRQSSYLCWVLLAMLVAQVVTFTSIGYFDQVMTFLCLNLAAIGSLWETAQAREGAVDGVASYPKARPMQGDVAGVGETAIEGISK